MVAEPIPMIAEERGLYSTDGNRPPSPPIPFPTSYTAFDNDLLDTAMAELSGAAWKVLSYLVRRTRGFHQDDARVSLAQICAGRCAADGTSCERGTGLSRKAVTLALAELHQCGVIVSDAEHLSQTQVRTYHLAPSGNWHFESHEAPTLQTRVKITRVQHDAQLAAPTRVKITPYRNKDIERKRKKDPTRASDDAQAVVVPTPPRDGFHVATGYRNNDTPLQGSGSAGPPPDSARPSPAPPAPTVAAPKPARVNPIWDALVALLDYEPKLKGERSNWGGCVKQLKEVGATPEQIAACGAAWLRLYPGAQLTVNALVKHWSELEAVVLRRVQPAASRPRPPVPSDALNPSVASTPHTIPVINPAEERRRDEAAWAAKQAEQQAAQRERMRAIAQRAGRDGAGEGEGGGTW